jgi:hypothetical protein
MCLIFIGSCSYQKQFNSIPSGKLAKSGINTGLVQRIANSLWQASARDTEVYFSLWRIRFRIS